MSSNTNELHPDSDEPPLYDQSIYLKLQDLTYLTFVFIGIGLLWPWNCILSASQYFKHDIFQDTTIWSKIFTSSMMTTSTLSSMIFNIWLSRRQHSYSQRVIRGLIWEIIVFILLTFISLGHHWTPLWFNFVNVMILVLLSSVATAMTQNGIMAIANVHGGEYSQAVMVGQAIAGVLPSVVLLLVSFLSTGNDDADASSSNNGGILFYFLTTALVSAICIILYRITKVDSKLKENIGSYSEEEPLQRVGEDDTATPFKKENVPFEALFTKLRYLVLSIFTTFMVTLVFPVFASTITATKIPMKDSQYIPLIFTVWNLGDLYGRVIADWPIFRNPNFTAFKVFIYAILRIIFVPFFFIIEHKNNTTHSIMLDVCYILLQFFFGVTNGHAISVSFMKVPDQLVSDDEKEAAGGFTNIFVSTGLAVGSVLSYLVVLFTGH
ncbi:hypothetical protein NCAS_0F01650 [Naumovozyma castellii]|uniref:Nucleoside transporter FUN26 n=1 Tax=Naumovozyma castellii TaxID=27288 RepID=G0VGM8_NAUCA|nr:hypothetical protein NCAS_0F01650 [Naumovozyma castellii CBS 4309]CCC70649.1 hypothetical protein NCAS_0F01650 [Naumovozyma castellii CBS 4309]